jgi:hypothetical protein
MTNHSDSGSAISLDEDTAPPVDSGQLDSAGHVVLKLLHKGAGPAEAISQIALETSRQLANQLRAAQNRNAELETEVRLYREKSERAEEWLRKISVEIEDRLIAKSGNATTAIIMASS